MSSIIERFLAVISKQVDHLERMTGDLLDSARIEAGQVDLHLEYCDLREIIRNVQELFITSSTAHQLEVSVPREPVWLRADELRIQQVLTNLVSNAINAPSIDGAWSSLLSMLVRVLTRNHDPKHFAAV